MVSGSNPSRTDVRKAVSCPECDAPKGLNCKRLRGGIRQSNHMERVQKYRSLYVGVPNVSKEEAIEVLKTIPDLPWIVEDDDEWG